MTTSTAQDERTRLVAYIPPSLHRWVKAKASAENRTISNFVETLLADLQRSDS